MSELPTDLLPAPKHPELPHRSLRWYADPALFGFTSTHDVQPLDGIIGQRRAIEALSLGAEIYSPGYNIFVSGLAGTGRLSTIKSMLERLRPNFNVPHDYAYVHNFDNPDAPSLLVFPRGKAASFQRQMENMITYLRTHVVAMFDDEKFRAGRANIVAEFQSRERAMLDTFDAALRPQGFTLGQRKTGETVQPEILPIVEEKPVPIETLPQLVEAGTLTEEQAKQISATYATLRGTLYSLVRDGMSLSQEFQEAMDDYEHEAARMIVEPTIDNLRTRFPFDGVRSYLDAVAEDVLENLELFRQAGEPTPEEEAAKRELFKDYTVNVVLDNAKTSGSPVIIETTPTFVNLFGTIERVYDPRTGAWSTDFTQIKGGSLLRADGGYLIVNATDALSEPGVWKALKRVLLHRKLEIQPIESFFQASGSSASALKPEPINLNVKVIMIGDSRLYQVLFDGEEDFRKIFKINAQFDYEIERTDGVIQDYARFVRRMSDEEQLLHFEAESVAAVVEYAVEKAGNISKISLRFSDIADLLREASFWAERAGAEVVSRSHVEKAYEMMVDRNAMWKDKTLAQITDGLMMIDTSGRRVGQINGLAVYSAGQTSFGKPTRITATVAVGTGGIINIDREARLTGSIYNKGTMILNGFFRNRYAQKQPLVLSASIVFEQSYGGVEGDSASSTEVYALLSALSRVPIRQELAVTGSVNQWGEIQPIGGVKEKIEGFFDLCKLRGLTGTQGVLIPVQNVSDLMLNNEVVDAVAEGKFHVYAIASIDQGIEVLTGVAAGARDADGEFPAGSINYLVQLRLHELSEAVRRTMPLPAESETRVVHVEAPAPEQSAWPDIGGGDEDDDE